MSHALMTDEERELHIRDCGRLMQEAHAQGNRQEAMDWLQAEMLAIAQRSPAQVARMTERLERAIDEGSDYFSVMGAQHAVQIHQGGVNGR